MQTGKRKRSGGDREEAEDRTRVRARGVGGEDCGVQTATEDEVEEFFAILRRLHKTAEYFGSGRGKGGVPEKGAKWRPEFVMEDFKGAGTAGKLDDEEVGASRKMGPGECRLKGMEEAAGKRAEGEERRFCCPFDLNTDPEVDQEAARNLDGGLSD